MYRCVIVAQSATAAQNVTRTLTDAGFTANTQKIQGDLSPSGCSWGVKLPGSQVAAALQYLYRLGYGTQKIFCDFGGGAWREYTP